MPYWRMRQSLWNFSLAVYADKAVQDECLALQDQFGLDVNLILLCAFLGAEHGIALTSDDIASARQAVRQWHDEIVRPLRAARRSLKTAELPDAQQLRTQVKATELEAERIEQTMLQGWIDARLPNLQRGDARTAVNSNLDALLSASGVDRASASSVLKNTIAAALAR